MFLASEWISLGVTQQINPLNVNTVCGMILGHSLHHNVLYSKTQSFVTVPTAEPNISVPIVYSD